MVLSSRFNLRFRRGQMVISRVKASMLFAVGLLVAWLASNAAAEQAAGPEPVTFGVVPQQAASKLARLWVPVFDYLGRSAGLEIRFRTAPNIPEFERRVAAGEYDLAYMNPYHYTVFSEETGYRAFAKAKGQLLEGILVVRKDSPIQDPHELSGATLAFPAPAAFAASVLTRAYLTQEGIEFTPKFVSSHDSVYLTVARGLYPGGGGVVRTLNSLTPEVRDQLRVLWTTQGYTPHAFAAHPRVSPETVKRVAEAMTAMDQEEEWRALLAPLGMDGFEAAQDSDWDDVRALGIDLLNDLVKPAQ
jgi:phosphonate transport system substrate-binding protein